VFRTESYQTAQIGKWNTGIDSGRGRDWDDQVVGNRPRVPENAGSYFYDPLLVTNNGESTHEKTYRTDHCINLAIGELRRSKAGFVESMPATSTGGKGVLHCFGGSMIKTTLRTKNLRILFSLE